MPIRRLFKINITVIRQNTGIILFQTYSERVFYMPMIKFCISIINAHLPQMAKF